MTNDYKPRPGDRFWSFDGESESHEEITVLDVLEEEVDGETPEGGPIFVVTAEEYERTTFEIGWNSAAMAWTVNGDDI